MELTGNRQSNFPNTPSGEHKNIKTCNKIFPVIVMDIGQGILKLWIQYK